MFTFPLYSLGTGSSGSNNAMTLGPTGHVLDLVWVESVGKVGLLFPRLSPFYSARSSMNHEGTRPVRVYHLQCYNGRRRPVMKAGKLRRCITPSKPPQQQYTLMLARVDEDLLLQCHVESLPVTHARSAEEGKYVAMASIHVASANGISTQAYVHTRNRRKG